MSESLVLEPGEKVLVERQRHWVSLAPIYASVGMLLLAVLAITYLLGRYWPQINRLAPAASGFLVLALAALGVLCVLIAITGIWIWRQNRLVVTTLHVIQVNQNGLFNKSVSQLSLMKVQDVTYRQSGPLASMYNFGDIEIETAGEEENFVFRQVGDPRDLVQQIMQAHEAIAKNNPSAEV